MLTIPTSVNGRATHHWHSHSSREKSVCGKPPGSAVRWPGRGILPPRVGAHPRLKGIYSDFVRELGES